MNSEEKASFRSFQMISNKESQVRKIVGGSVEVGLMMYLLLFGFDSVPVGLQTVLHSAGIVVYRMGVESQ